MLIEDKTILKNIRKSVGESCIAAFLIILFGIILLKNPDNFLAVAIHIFGYGAVFVGILDLVFYFRSPREQRFFSKRLTGGILLISFGIIAFFEVNLLKEMITILLGGYLLFQNANRLELCLYLKNYTNRLWKILSIFSLLNLLLAFVLILNPFHVNIASNMYMAILLIVIEFLVIVQNVCILIGVHQDEKEK